MNKYIFDEITDYTENYKNKIRGSAYDAVVTRTTQEKVSFLIYTDEEGEKVDSIVVVDFELNFSFSFEDGFYYTKFSNFSFEFDDLEFPTNMIDKLTEYIKENFVNSERLSQ